MGSDFIMNAENAPTPKYIGGGAPLKVVRRSTGREVVLSVEGELDRETTPRLATALSGALAETAERIELDLSGVTFIDSHGLRILLDARRRAGDETDVVVVRPSAQVSRLLHLTGVTELFGIAD